MNLDDYKVQAPQFSTSLDPAERESQFVQENQKVSQSIDQAGRLDEYLIDMENQRVQKEQELRDSYKLQVATPKAPQVSINSAPKWDSVRQASGWDKLEIADQQKVYDGYVNDLSKSLPVGATNGMIEDVKTNFKKLVPRPEEKGWFQTVKEGFAKGQDILGSGTAVLFSDDKKTIASEIADTEKSKASQDEILYKQRQQKLAEEFDKAKGIWDSTKALGNQFLGAVSSPKQFVGTTAESMGSSLPAIGTGLAGMKTGALVGGAIGAGAGAPAAGVGAVPGGVAGSVTGGAIGAKTGYAIGNVAVNILSSTHENIVKELLKANPSLNISDANAVQAELEKNPQIPAKAKEEGLKQGGAQGATETLIDLATVAGLGKLAKVAPKSATGKVAKTTAVGVVGATGEAGGEFGGSVAGQAVSQGPISYGQATQEGIMALGGGIVNKPLEYTLMAGGKAKDSIAKAIQPDTTKTASVKTQLLPQSEIDSTLYDISVSKDTQDPNIQEAVKSRIQTLLDSGVPQSQIDLALRGAFGEFGTYNPSETGSEPNTEAPTRLLKLLSDQKPADEALALKEVEDLAKEHYRGYERWASQDEDPNSVKREPTGFINGTVDNILATAVSQGINLEPLALERGKKRLSEVEQDPETQTRYDLGDRRDENGNLTPEGTFQKEQGATEVIPTNQPTEVDNAIQEQTTSESVLRQPSPSQETGSQDNVGLSEVGIGNENTNQQTAEQATKEEVTPRTTQESTPKASAELPTKQEVNTASWVIKNKETGEVVLEIFDKKKVDSLNTDKYEAVPIKDHLASLSKTNDTQATKSTYTPTSQVDSPSVGVLNNAKRKKENAFEKLKRVKREFKDGKANQLDVIKATDEHKTAIREFESAKAKVEGEANKQGQTTKKPTIQDKIKEQIEKVAEVIDSPTEAKTETKDLQTESGIVEVPISDLSLSEDVAQFKKGANQQGVVNKLEGKFDRRLASPIQVWKRLDGKLEIISGRHRFDLAKRSGETTIPAQINDESKGFTADDASLLDIELNVMDGRGNVKDYIDYFRALKLTEKEARDGGLLQTAVGKNAFDIATKGSEETITSFRNEQINVNQAVTIAKTAPNDEKLQSVGLRYAIKGDSAEKSANMMRAVASMGGGDTNMDMFGFDDTAIKEAEAIANQATKKQREIKQKISAVSGAVKNPAVAKELGVDVKDPNAVQSKIEELRQELSELERFETNPELVQKLRQEAGLTSNFDLQSPTVEDVLNQQTIAENEAITNEQDRIKRQSEAGADTFSLDMQEGRVDDTGSLFSQGNTTQSGNTTNSIKENLKNSGLANNQITVVQSVDDVNSEGWDGFNANGIQGFYNPKTGEIVLIADNIPLGKEVGVALHEIVHRSESQVLTPEQSKQLVNQVKSWKNSKQGSVERQIYENANQRAKDSGNYEQEFLKYAVEEAVNAGVAPNSKAGTVTASGWLAKVKEYFTKALKKLAPNFKGELTANDLVDIAYGIAQKDADSKAVITNQDIQFSQKSVTDILDQLDQGVVIDPKDEGSKLKKLQDWIIDSAIDGTRALDVWARRIPDLVARSSLIMAKDRGQLLLGVRLDEANKKFMIPLAKESYKVAKKIGNSQEYVREQLGYWMTAKYAQIKNADFIAQDKQALDDAKQEATDLQNELDSYDTQRKTLDQMINSNQATNAKFNALDIVDRKITRLKAKLKATKPSNVQAINQIKQDIADLELQKKNIRNTAKSQGNTQANRDLLRLVDREIVKTQSELTKAKTAETKAQKQYDERVKAVNNPDDKLDVTKTNQTVGLAGGLNDATAQNITSKVEAQIDKADLESMAKHIYEMLDWNLKGDLKTGKTTIAQVSQWLNSPYYVPLTGDPRTDTGADDAIVSGSINIGKDKKALGAKTSNAQDAISTAWGQVQKSASHFAWNDFKTELTSLYEKSIADKVATGMTETEAKKAVQEELGITRQPETAVTNPQNSVIVRKGGKNYAYQFDDQSVTDALRGANNESVGFGFNMVRNVTRFMSRLMTQFMPGFAQINFLRDIGDKTETIRTRGIDKYPNVDMDKVARTALKTGFNPNTTRIIASALTELDSIADLRPYKLLASDKNNPDYQLFQQMIADGGLSTVQGMYAGNAIDLRENLSRANSKIAKGLEIVNRYNEIFDSISSFSVYKGLVEQGVDSKTAATTTANLMNFKKRGSKMANVSALYAFAQPIATGGYQLAKTLNTPRGKKRFVAYLVAGIILYSFLRSLDYDDETGENRMDKSGNLFLERNIRIPYGNGKYFDIPVPFGTMQLAWSTATNLVKMANKTQSVGDTAGELIKGAVKTVAPISPSEQAITENFDKWLLATVSPTSVRPITNVAMDSTAFGGRLTNDKFKPQDVPKSQFGMKNTAQWYKDVADVMAKDLGVDVYPETVKEIINGYGVGPLREITKAYIEIPSKKERGVETADQWSDRYIKQMTDSQFQDKLYYQALNEMADGSKNVKLERASETDKKLADMLKQAQTATMPYSRQRSALYKRRDNLQQDEFLTQLKRIENQENQAQLRILKKYLMIKAEE